MDFPGEKLVIKMWDTLVEKGIGSLLVPWQIVREGRAHNQIRREELLMLAQAEKDAADMRAGRKQLRGEGARLLLANNDLGGLNNANADISGRIEPTLGLPEAIRATAITDVTLGARTEINSAKAILYAEEQLVNDPQIPPDRDVDEDWLFAWRDYAGKVSIEDLQRLWGSILAGEIKSPGTYSLRTLEFLKTLSKSDANLIGMVARYAIAGRIARSEKKYLEDNGVTFTVLLQMQELGLLTGVDAVGLKTIDRTAIKGGFLLVLKSNGKALLIEHDDATKSVRIEVYKVTEIGNQVFGLGTFEPDLTYLRSIGKQIAGQGFFVRLCDWLQISETEGRYFNAEPITP